MFGFRKKPVETTVEPPVEIHLINPMTDIGGSELHTLDMYRLLSRFANATIWTEREPHPQLAKLAPIRRVNFKMLRFPKYGVFLFTGAYFEVGQWWSWAQPSRAILLYNISNRARLDYALHRLSLGGQRKIEMLYASEAMKKEAGLPGIVEDSPINLTVFAPAEFVRDATAKRSEFVVGRCSRDDPLKFNEDDPVLFERLARWGVRLRIAGGTCLVQRMAPHPRIELLPMLSPLDLPQFLRGLDCFVYRTSAEWPEAYGRVVVEAMACGVPVVVARNAGVAQHIRDGVNGFLADTNEESMDILMKLRDDEALRRRIGEAARRSMEERYSVAQQKRIADFYLRRPEDGSALDAQIERPGDAAART